MKRVIFILAIPFVFACSKTEVPKTPPVVVVQEEAIKFTTNLDTGTYNVSDTLPLVIAVSSKLPSAGLVYSIIATWTDSSKQIFKLDTTLNTSNLSLSITGLNKTGKYSFLITVTSKTNQSNTANKTISAINYLKMPFFYDFQKAVRCFNDKPIEYDGEYLDINNDNVPDFIGINNNINSQSLIITDSNFKTIKSFNIWPKIPNRFTSFDPIRKVYVTDSLNSNSTAVGDLNNDGYKDVIINLLGEWGTPANSWYGGKTYVVFWKNNMTDFEVIELESELNIYWSGSIRVVDWNKDGWNDIMLPGKIYLNNKNNTFSKIDFKFNQVDPVIVMEFNDLNNDGFMDIITGHRTTIAVYLNNGKNDFTSKVYDLNIPTYSNAQASIEDLTFADIDKNGFNDIMVIIETLGSPDRGSKKFDESELVQMDNTNGVLIKNTNTEFKGTYYKWLQHMYSYAKDFDKDGDLDIFPTNYANNDAKELKTYYWENVNGKLIKKERK